MKRKELPLKQTIFQSTTFNTLIWDNQDAASYSRFYSVLQDKAWEDSINEIANDIITRKCDVSKNFFVSMLKNSNIKVRNASVWVLGELREYEILQELILALNTEENDSVRKQILKALAKGGVHVKLLL